jgi:hypothetical protein
MKTEIAKKLIRTERNSISFTKRQSSPLTENLLSPKEAIQKGKNSRQVRGSFILPQIAQKPILGGGNSPKNMIHQHQESKNRYQSYDDENQDGAFLAMSSP